MREARVKSTSTSFGLSSITTTTPITGFTEGSVIFIDSVPSLAEDNANFFWDDTANELGIGTNAPASTLDVRGTVSIGSGTTRVLVITNNANLTGADNSIAGDGAGAALTSGARNTVFGDTALAANTTASDNTAFGFSALDANTTGTTNVAIGVDALGANLTGNQNVAVGYRALLSSTAADNTAIGYQALNLNTSGTSLVAIGSQALGANTTASDNTAVGYNAGAAITIGTRNTALGSFALDTSTTANDNTAIGYNALSANTTGVNNTAIGSTALDALTTGNDNTAIGTNALGACTSGATNVAIGSSVLSGLTTGIDNVAIGTSTLQSLTTQNKNIAIGFQALRLNTGAQNTALGSSALDGNTTGSDNTAVGNSALSGGNQSRCTAVGSLALAANTGSFNTAVGKSAMEVNTSGASCVAIGAFSLDANTTASFNIAIGHGAVGANTTGAQNIGIGHISLDANTDSSNNTAVGYDSLGLSTGANNTAFGYAAGNNITTGANNLIIGYDVDAPSATGSNQLVIGNLIFGTGIDGTGTTLSTGNIGIGQNTPAAKLEVEIGATDAETGILIDQDDTDQIAFQIDSEATTADVIDIASPATTAGIVFDVNADALTTGSIFDLTSNSTDASIRTLVNIVNDNTGALGTVCLNLQQDAAGTAQVIDDNSDSICLDLDKDLTNAANTVNSLRIVNTSTVNDTLTYAKSGTVFSITNEVVETTGTITDTSITASFANTHADATGATVFINSDGTGAIALSIDSEGATADVIDIDTPVITTARCLDISNANSLTTGRIASFHSNSADPSTRILTYINNQNTLATGATVLTIEQGAAQNAVFIDQNADGRSLFIDSNSTSTDVVDINSLSETGDILSITGSSLTTGVLANFYSFSASTAARQLVQIWNDNGLAASAVPLRVIQDGATFALRIDQNANGRAISIDPASSTTADVVYVEGNLLTTGKLAHFYSNDSSTATRNLVQITNDSVSATNARCLYLQQDAPKTALFIDQNGENLSLYIDSEQTSTDVFQIDTPTTTTGKVFIANPNSLTSGFGIQVTTTSGELSSGELLDLSQTASANSLTNKTGNLTSISTSRTDTRTSLTTTDDFDVLNIARTQIMNGTGGTMDADGALIKLESTATQTLGTLTMDVIGIEMALNARSASDVYAVKITQDNAGTGLPGGIDMSTFSAAEPLFNVPVDTTAEGAYYGRIAVNVTGVGIRYISLHAA